MIVSRTFGHRRVLAVYLSETTKILHWSTSASRTPEDHWLDVRQLLRVAVAHDRRKRRTGWEPPGAVVLYLLVGLWVRVRLALQMPNEPPTP